MSKVATNDLSVSYETERKGISLQKVVVGLEQTVEKKKEQTVEKVRELGIVITGRGKES